MHLVIIIAGPVLYYHARAIQVPEWFVCEMVDLHRGTWVGGMTA